MTAEEGGKQIKKREEALFSFVGHQELKAAPFYRICFFFLFFSSSSSGLIREVGQVYTRIFSSVCTPSKLLVQ